MKTQHRFQLPVRLDWLELVSNTILKSIQIRPRRRSKGDNFVTFDQNLEVSKEVGILYFFQKYLFFNNSKLFKLVIFDATLFKQVTRLK